MGVPEALKEAMFERFRKRPDVTRRGAWNSPLSAKSPAAMGAMLASCQSRDAV